MTLNEFEAEIKQLHEGFSVVLNPNRPGLANIFFNGKNYDLPVVSAIEIKDEPDPTYTYQFPNGISARLWAKSEIMPRIKSFLELAKEGNLDEIYG